MPVLWRWLQRWLARRLVRSFEKQARRQFGEAFGGFATDDTDRGPFGGFDFSNFGFGRRDDSADQTRAQAENLRQQREMRRRNRHAYAIHYMRQFSEPVVFEEVSVFNATGHYKDGVRFDRTTIVFTSQISDADWTDLK